ncbi:hypothetical protein S7711_09689 [Stachybotrys chartarum IBT 7711]|uniref:Uncharacterized protein n=1 Tax=Stachybotrys chartarum (strain CBS 109288 / IBT 7711) TaxID=1280523 RepID=A0A084B1F5_STACB|nr:hypothetical protein S7711_09689 [Stachybotrys chartarum IBT 7711]
MQSAVATTASQLYPEEAQRPKHFSPCKAFIAAYDSVRSAFGDAKATALWNKRRNEIIQVWRPFRGPVVDWPLAVCNSQSVDAESDLIATDKIWSFAVTETYSVFHSPDH